MRESEESRTSEPAWKGKKALVLYSVAGVTYIVLGVYNPALLFSWWEGVPFLLFFVWVAHSLRRRVL